MAVRTNYYISSGSGSGGSGGGGGDDGSLTSKQATYQKDLAANYVAQKQSENGGILKPEFYREAADLYLKDHLDNNDVAETYYKYQNDSFALQNKISQSQSAVKNDYSEMLDALRQNTEYNASNPDAFIMNQASLYMTRLDYLDQVLQDKLASGEDVAYAVTAREDIADKARNLMNLSLIRNPEVQQATGLPEGVSNETFNLAVKITTDFKTGKVIDMDIVNSDEVMTDAKLGELNTTYSGLPVYGNIKDGMIKVGDDVFQQKPLAYNNNGEVSDRETVFKKVERKPGKLWGEITEYREEVEPVDLNKINPIKPTEFGQGTIVKDTNASKPSYYYYGKDGWYKAEDTNVLKQFANVNDDYINNAPMVLRETLNFLPNLVDEMGNTRILNNDMLTGKLSAMNYQGPQVDFKSIVDTAVQRQQAEKPAMPTSISAYLPQMSSLQQSPVTPQQSPVPVAEVPRHSPVVQETGGLTGMLNKAKSIFLGR